jgi:hypothetical protein
MVTVANIFLLCVFFIMLLLRLKIFFQLLQVAYRVYLWQIADEMRFSIDPITNIKYSQNKIDLLNDIRQKWQEG